jgi:hypothetical protein
LHSGVGYSHIESLLRRNHLKSERKASWGGRYKKIPVFKVPRQCPFVLLIEVCSRESKTLVSEEIKSQDVDLAMRREEKLIRGFYCI